MFCFPHGVNQDGTFATESVADRGLVPEAEEAFDQGSPQDVSPERIPALPDIGFVNGRQCEGLYGLDFGELLLDATKSPDPFVPADLVQARNNVTGSIFTGRLDAEAAWRSV